jgi:superfamily I DNA and/or RNA helicase
VVAVVRHLLAAGERRSSIGIISPYLAQVSEIGNISPYLAQVSTSAVDCC